MSSPDPLDCIDLPINVRSSSVQTAGSPREIKRRRIESPSKSSDLPPGSPPVQRYEPVFEPLASGQVSPDKDARSEVSATPNELITGSSAEAALRAEPGALVPDDAVDEDVDDEATEPEDYSVDMPAIAQEERPPDHPLEEDVAMNSPAAAEDTSMKEESVDETAGKADQADAPSEAIAAPGSLETAPTTIKQTLTTHAADRGDDTDIQPGAASDQGQADSRVAPVRSPDATLVADTMREVKQETDQAVSEQAIAVQAEAAPDENETSLVSLDQSAGGEKPGGDAVLHHESAVAHDVEGEEELDPKVRPDPDTITDPKDSAAPSGASSPAKSTPSMKPKKSSKPKPKSKVAEVKARERAGSSLAPSDVTSSEKEGEELLCLCRKKFDEEDEEGIMVACDGGCEGWYHPGCIGMSEDDLQRLDKYICDKCAKDTTLRTVYHQQCARSECIKAVGARSSKYCSSSCAFNHMAGFIPQTPTPKLLKQLSAAFIGLPRPSSRIKVTHHEAVDPVTNDDQVQKQLDVVEQSMAMLRRRQEILAQLMDGAENLPPLEVKATTAAKKKGGARSTAEDRPCGWSARLLWADDEVESWDEAGAGPDDVCMAPRRRCDRHAGWLKSVPLSMTVEEQQLLRRKDVLEARLGHEKMSREVKVAADQAREDMLRRLSVGQEKPADAVKAA